MPRIRYAPEAGWSTSPCAIGEQRSFTNGRIIVTGGKVRRGKQKRSDYLHRHTQVLKAEHKAIREANAALLPATLERVFSPGESAHA